MTGESGFVADQRIVSQLNPHAEILLHQANELKTHDEYAKAIEMYDQVLRIEPKNSRALHSKANVLDMLGRHEEAVSYYESALACDPLNAETWYNKGVTLQKLGHYNESMHCIQRGLYITLGNE